MFLNIWNYLRGYVTIEVSGFSVERFINLAAHRGIYIWDVHPNGSKISMKMGIKGFKRLKGCTKKTKCKMRIVQKEGLPFLTFKYRNRKIFAVGVLFFIVALFILSSFIWVVEISGNERIKKEALLEYCAEIGLKPGAFKHSIDTHEMTDSFLTQFNDLSWIAIDIKGTKASITIVETIPAPKIIDKTTPCDIVAAADGLITDVVVITGTPSVKVKDIVKKGDILVSGMLTIMDGEEIKGYHYTHAEAEVCAKVWYEADLSEPLTYTRKDFTGKKKKHYAINMLDKKINLFNTGIPYSKYDKIVHNKPLNLGGDFALPISVDVTEYSEYNSVLLERSVEETEDLLLQKVDKLVEKKLEDDGISFIDKKTTTEQKDGKIFIHAEITLEQRIDVVQEVSAEAVQEAENAIEPDKEDIPDNQADE